MEDVNKENMMSQAQNVWTMLDDMAENDPQAYRKFIDKQLKDGKEYMRLPDPHMCVRTTYVDKSKDSSGTLYINLCEWSRVPKPPDETAPIPVIGGIMGNLEEKGVMCKLVSLGFNTKFLEDYGIAAKVQEEQQSLIHLAIDFVKDHYKISVPYSYVLLPRDTPHKGTLKMLRDGLKAKVHTEDKAYEKQMKDLSESFAPLSGKNVAGDSLLSQLSNLSTDAQPIHSNGCQNSVPNINLDSSTKSKAPNKNLIQEIGSSDISPNKPSYSLSMKESDGTKQRRIVVKIELPNVESVTECELDVEQGKLMLSAPSKIKDLEVLFTESVCCDDSTAKFNKKTRTLTIVIPTVQS